MSSNRSRVLIAGGGVGALEAALALRALAADRVDVTLLAPERHFTYRALSVGEPFGLGTAVQYELRAIAEDRGLELVRDALDSVDPDLQEVVTQDGAVLGYDHLILALGARPKIAVSGALTFRGPQDADRTGIALATIAAHGTHVIFAAPAAATWTLPLYELALLTAHWARRKAVRLHISVVTPEPAPLALFGPRASAEVAALLERAHIDLRCGRAPSSFAHGRLALADGGSLPAGAVVALPRLEGPEVPGLPRNAEGFVETDDFGRVTGADHVYAVGDMTARTIKQGGLAAQQAEVAAKAIAFAEGAAIEPAPHRPVLRGLLLTGETPRYLRSEGESLATSDEALWWPPHKIASRYLGPYLAAEGGALAGSGGRVMSPGAA